MPFVLDASVVLAWHFRDEDSVLAERVSERSYRDRVVVPQHWALEVSSALLRGERRLRSDLSDVDLFIERLRALDLETDSLSPEQVYSAVLPIARRHRLSVYDAAYLELSQRLELQLATLDTSVTAVARRLGVHLIEESGG